MSARITEAAARAARLFIRNYLIERDEACGFHSDEDEWDESAREIFDGVAAAISTEPGEAALHYECASAGCERPATVHFIRADVGSYYCRECYMRVQAIPAAPLPKDTHHG